MCTHPALVCDPVTLSHVVSGLTSNTTVELFTVFKKLGISCCGLQKIWNRHHAPSHLFQTTMWASE
jgi:hypothetical protein